MSSSAPCAAAEVRDALLQATTSPRLAQAGPASAGSVKKTTSAPAPPSGLSSFTLARGCFTAVLVLVPPCEPMVTDMGAAAAALLVVLPIVSSSGWSSSSSATNWGP